MPMFRANHQAWARIASGIEAGVVGGAAMLALLLSESMWDGHVWWEVPNLFGSTFYGPRAFRAGPGMSTFAGIALHFVITGSIGALFGLAFGGVRQRGRLVLFGLLAAIGWYNLANSAFWPAVNPWVLVASPRPATMFSHVLLGACLGYMGQRPRSGGSLPSLSSQEPAVLLSPAPPYDERNAEPEPVLVAEASIVEATASECPTPEFPPAEPAPSEPGQPEPPAPSSSGPPAASSFSALE